MSAATQVYYASFDAVFLKLPATLRARVDAKIDEIGLRLRSYPHHRLKDRIGSGLAWATIESFTPSTRKRIRVICWQLGIGGRFIAVSKIQQATRKP